MKEKMEESIENRNSEIEAKTSKEQFLYEVWSIIKYQLLTKIVTLLIFGTALKFLFNKAMNSMGKSFVTSGDFLQFLLSWQGVSIILIAIIFIVTIIGTDINAFIIMTAGLKNRPKSRVSSFKVFFLGIKSVKKLITPGGVMLVGLMCLMVPVAGMGYSISAIDKFKIPNFITSVIYNTPLYLAIYITVVIGFVLLLILGMFTLHFMLLGGYKAGKSFKLSVKLIKNHPKEYFKKFILFDIIVIAIAAIVVILSIIIVYIFIGDINLESFKSKMYFLIYAFTLAEIFGLTVFISFPLIIRRVTKLFYALCKEDNIQVLEFGDVYDIEKKTSEKKRKKRRIPVVRIAGLAVIAMLFNTGASALMAYAFDDIFLKNSNIQIIAHRGGGDLAAENTLEGIKKAHEKGAKWSEIDVQRTKDGKYVINHDNTFKRLTGENKASTEMTLDEIKKLKVKDKFNKDGQSQPVATLEEVLDAAKGKIGVFVELKGKTADTKMADDVIKLVKEKNMENEIAILSLDYEMIKYVEKKYPEITTGFLYYFSFGDFTKLEGDFLVMEEGEATEDNIFEIHQAGKKAIVWTVNKDSSVLKYTKSNIDGIITDHVTKVEEALKENNKKKNPIDLIIDFFFE